MRYEAADGQLESGPNIDSADETLAIAAGQPIGVDELTQQYVTNRNLLIHIASELVHDWHTAQDLTQEAYVSLHNSVRRGYELRDGVLLPLLRSALVKVTITHIRNFSNKHESIFSLSDIPVTENPD